MKSLIFLSVLSFASVTTAQTALEPQTVAPDRTVEQLRKQADLDKKIRLHLMKLSPWTCEDAAWKDGIEPEKPLDNVSNEIPPGEELPIGNLIPKTEYPRGMIIVHALGGCTSSFTDSNKLFVDEKDILEKFFDVREIISTTSSSPMENGKTGTLYYVRQRNYDDAKKPLDMFSYIAISFDPVNEELYVNLKMDHLVANPGDQGNLLKKFREIIHVKRESVGEVSQLKLETEWNFWAANPSRLAKTFWGTAKSRIKKNNIQWREDLMQYFLTSAVNPPLIDISKVK